MATTYKYFSQNDRIVATNSLTEQVSNKWGSDSIQAWISSSHTPYYFVQYGSSSNGSSLWAEAERVFDITLGRSSLTNGAVGAPWEAENSIYNQFSKILLGYDQSNNIQYFRINDYYSDGYLHNAFFINFSRSQFKDKIKQGSVALSFEYDGGKYLTLVDSGSNGVELTECRTGYYGKLFLTASSDSELSDLSTAATSKIQGLIFYEAGIAVISPYIFSEYNSTYGMPSSSNSHIDANKYGALAVSLPSLSGSYNVENMVTGASILQNAYGLSTHFQSASYQAVTELNSTIYFCRAFNHEFNYSSNPSYLNNSEIIVKGGDPEAQPVSYITTVGLYSDDNQLLAVAKLSEPIKKTPENELIARVRLDF